MSSGIQKAVADGLRYLVQKVEDGAYGEGDDAFQEDFIVEAFEDDFDEVVMDEME